MACFPRLFPRQKNSFNPAEDDNKETLLNQENNPVKIGRYIRREETPVFPTKNSTRGQKVQFKDTNEENDNNKSNNNSFNKKFIPNRSKIVNHNNNNTTNSNNNNSNGIASVNSNNHIEFKNPHANPVQTKFKPVRERRPTALPTEVPKIDDDLESDIEIFEHNSHTGTPSGTPTVKNTKFFIGNHDGDDDNVSVYTKLSEAQIDLSITSAIRLKDLEVNDTFKTNFNESLSNGDMTDGPDHGNRNHSNLSYSYIPKYSSLNRNKTIGTPTSTPQNETPPEVYIPPPPPLPPQPLVTASSSSSLFSNRSGKSRRRQSRESDLDFKSNNDLQSSSYTFVEILKCSTSYSVRSRTTATANSLNGRDSGVQIEDAISTPKDSDSSGSHHAHRIEGGLIYTRKNFPTQKNVNIEFIVKDDVTRNLIRTAIEKNDFLNNYMDKERKEMVIDAMEPATYRKDSFIINENEEGSEIFVSAEGNFNVLKKNEVIASFGPATVFGELAILYNATRFASIQATTFARVWKISREKFRKIMVISGSIEREENLHFLRSVPFLNDLSEEVLSRVVDLLQRKFYETNSCIVREGDVGNEFFIIRGGTVTIKKKNDDGEERVVDRRKRGDYFGEQALLNADTRQASVYADPPGTEVLKLDREAFISYLGTIPQLHELPESESADRRSSNRKQEFNNKYSHIQLVELNKVATLGAGAFGRVDLVENNGKTFALKIIKKIDIIKQDQVEHVYSEKHVMMKCSSSPFIIELYKTFRDDKYVYFLMEACMGGDVWTIMSQRRFFDEKTARFIAGCVVEAFEFLHSQNIIYRDLKPENLMLSTDGYCKLVDFGFAKHIPPNQKTNTFAGTPEYVAPEIILDRGHDRAVDYWALGILIYELLVGKTPFRGQNQIKIYQQILGGIDVIQMPSKIPKSAQGLIKHLCKQLPAERLGYQRKGIADIKKHSWFDSLDWHKLKNKQLVSPIKRPISSSTDTQYFGPAGVENDYEPPDETSGWDIDF